jgi:hypothetical protein
MRWTAALVAVGLAVSARLPAGQPAAADGAQKAPPAGKSAADWVRAGMNVKRPTWGVRGGLVWGLPPKEGRTDGPRGLLRVRFPTLPRGEYDLINFIAVEPVVRGQKGYSELEPSKLDGVQGKRLWAANPGAADDAAGSLPAGKLARLPSGAESLAVRVGVERFDNGAQVELTVTQYSSDPDEIELTVHASPDSAPIEYCILTATMGNKARARRLWLADEVAGSLDLYRDHRDAQFAPHRFFPLERLWRNAAGDVLAAITTDERDPAKIDPYPGRRGWRYGGFPVTQYWKKPAGTRRDDLHVAVNGRYTYWLSRQPIPGGVAFENFEMRERFYQDQRFVFGITRKTPEELGLPTPRESTRPGATTPAGSGAKAASPGGQRKP